MLNKESCYSYCSSPQATAVDVEDGVPHRCKAFLAHGHGPALVMGLAMQQCFLDKGILQPHMCAERWELTRASRSSLVDRKSFLECAVFEA